MLISRAVQRSTDASIRCFLDFLQSLTYFASSQPQTLPSITSSSPPLLGIREWFRWYKTPDDKPLNGFGFDEKWLDRKAALEVIHETHEYWVNLKAGKTDKGKVRAEEMRMCAGGIGGRLRPILFLS